MTDPAPVRTPLGGGFLLVVALFGGFAIGTANGQPSAGFLAGAAVGVLALIVLAVVERMRR